MMNFKCVAICTFPLVLAMARSSASSAVHLQCPAPRTTAMRFSIMSRRNSSGQWTSQVALGHSAERMDTSSGPWEIDVEQGTERCSQGMETVLITATITAPPQVGVPGYEFVPGHGYYRLYKIPATWNQARKVCEEDGSHLLVLNSNAEATALRQQVLSSVDIQGTSDNSYLHVGFHDAYEEGDYVTVLGYPLNGAGFSTWMQNEPNNDGNEDCGSMHRSGKLNDVACWKQLYFICEQGL